MVCIFIVAMMVLDSILISASRLLCVSISSSSKYELSYEPGFRKHILTLTSSNIINHLGPMSLEPNP